MRNRDLFRHLPAIESQRSHRLWLGLVLYWSVAIAAGLLGLVL
jgi:hypothetical protein